MKFHAKESVCRILNRGNSIVGPARNVKAFGQPDNMIAVTIPDF